jgi:hypothetical protein
MFPYLNRSKRLAFSLIFLCSFLFLSGYSQAQTPVCKQSRTKFEFSYYGYEIDNSLVTIRIGVKNNNKFNVSHVAFELPGITRQALNPKNENPDYEYMLENTTKNPFGNSLKFNLISGSSYYSGREDIFIYQIPLTEFLSMTSFQVLAKAGLEIGTVSFNPLGCCVYQVDILGPDNICAGSSQTYSVTPISGANTYVWMIPAGWQLVSGQGTNTISVINNGQTGEISIHQGIASCGKLKVNVSPYTLAPPAAITGPDTVCINNYYFYQVPAVPNVNYYYWTVPAGWQILSSPIQSNGYSNRILVRSGTQTGQITAAAVGICVTSPTVSMSAFASPVAFTSVISGEINPCPGSFKTYTVTGKNIGSYFWSVPGDYNIISGQGTKTLTVKIGQTKGEVKVMVKDRFGCSDATTSLNLDPTIQARIISQPQPVSETVGNNVSFTVEATGPALAYRWQVNYGAGWLNINENLVYHNSTTNTLEIQGAPIYLNGSQFRAVVSSCSTELFSSGGLLTLKQNGTTANIKVFLEGPYNAANGTMRNTLNAQAVLPSINPYRTAPWNYQGPDSIPAGFFAAHQDIIDWVLIELRTGLTPATKTAVKACLINANGIIVDLDGKSLPVLPNVSSGNFYLIVFHRIHLPVISKNTVPLSQTSALYDFTTSYMKSYGVNPLKKMTDNKWALFTGDADANGSVSTSDWNNYYKNELKLNGYRKSDWNLDGTVSPLDYNLWYVNGGATTQVLR